MATPKSRSVTRGRPAVAVADEDVGGLDVAVDDEAAVGVGDGRADVEEEADARGHAEAVGVAVRGDGHALDEVHRQIGTPVGRGAAVDEAGDAVVRERGEERALGLEAPHDARRVHPPPHDLERDGVGVEAVGAARAVDGAHPAAPDLGADPPRPDAGAVGEVVAHIGSRGAVAEEHAERGRVEAGRGVEEGGVGVGVEEDADLGGDVGVGECQEASAVLARRIARRAEESLDGGPAVGSEQHRGV